MADEVEESHSIDVSTSASGPDSTKSRTRVHISTVDSRFDSLPIDIRDQTLDAVQHSFTSTDAGYIVEALTASIGPSLSVSSSKSHLAKMIQFSEAMELLAYRDTYEADVFSD